MLPKNIRIFTTHKVLQMKKMISSSSALFTCMAAIILCCMLNSCSKAKEAIQEAQATYLEQQFNDNILGKNFRVQLATDTAVDITAQFSGYVFVMTKSTYYNGPATATKSGVIYNGTWSSNDDYSKFVINFPTAPAQIVFINREWRFTKKALPIMELAPWGTTDPKVLHLERF